MSVAMQVSIEKTGQHERKLNVKIPAERVENEINDRLKNIAKNAKLDGFRKGGKVSGKAMEQRLKVVKERYGDDARHEVIGKLVNDSLHDAIRQEGVILANQPTVDITSDKLGEPLEYNAIFEVYPDVTLKGVDKLKVDKPAIEITDEDMTEALEKVRKQFTDWKEVKRAAKDGDRITIDLVGTLPDEEEPFTDNKDMPVELGGGQMIPGFEDNLQKAKAGDEVTFEINFPSDYWEAKLADKPAQFTVQVKKVEGPELPEIDDSLAEKLGIQEGGLASLKEKLKEGLQKEAEHLLQQDLKEQLLDQLLSKNKVDVPQSLIDTELDMLKKNPNATKLKDGETIEDNAKRRVTLSLLLGQYIKEQEIALDQEKVQAAVRQMAMNYPDPEAIIKWFYQDQQRLSGVASMVLEDQAVEKMLEGVKASDKKLSYKDIAEKFSGNSTN